MANPEHLAKLQEGVELGTSGEENPKIVPDLRKADLRETSLRKADFRRANLHGANLSQGKLMGADFFGSNLSRANLNGSDLNGANLHAADLLGADLGGAHLLLANLTGTKLSEANLSRAIFAFTSLGQTQLRGAIGLDFCLHEAHSFLDYFALRDSWPLPIPFLRGCGLPDVYIDYLPSLLKEGIQFYSCFVSYSTEDQEFADRLYADLQNKGVRCWFAPHDIQGGKKIHEQIDTAIRVHDKLLLILSEHSMTSNWVQLEIAKARKREAQEKRQMLFPVSLVPYDLPSKEAKKPQSARDSDKPASIKEWELINSSGENVAEKIREYFIPDFSNWTDHNSYKQALDRLLRDLKAQPGAESPSSGEEG